MKQITNKQNIVKLQKLEPFFIYAHASLILFYHTWPPFFAGVTNIKFSCLYVPISTRKKSWVFTSVQSNIHCFNGILLWQFLLQVEATD